MIQPSSERKVAKPKVLTEGVTPFESLHQRYALVPLPLDKGDKDGAGFSNVWCLSNLSVAADDVLVRGQLFKSHRSTCV